MINPVTLREGHDNFFTPLRIFMAALVVIGHAIVVLTGDTSAEPNIFFHYTPSYTAVNAFFIASGFLVTKSMMYRGNMPNFSSARILRIFPALLVHVLIVAFVIGGLTTTLPLGEYLTHKDVLSQPAKVLSFYDTEMILPGVFKDNPEDLGSAALWTLRYEVLAYIGTAVAFSIGLMKRRWMIAAQFVVFALAYPIALRTGILDGLPATVSSLMRFGLAYGLGAAIYAYQDKIKLYWPAIPALITATALLNGMPEMEILANITLAYIVFWLAYVKAPKLNGLQKLDDISYGLYIYHWVVLQCFVLAMPNISALPLAIGTLIVASLVAWASWVLIEKPALKFKDRFASFLSLKKPAKMTAAQ